MLLKVSFIFLAIINSFPSDAVHRLGTSGSLEPPKSVENLTDYGKFEKEAVEIAGYGGIDARGMVLAFLICDGDSQRKQREILFDPKWKVIGVGAGPHSSTHEVRSLISLC